MVIRESGTKSTKFGLREDTAHASNGFCHEEGMIKQCIHDVNNMVAVSDHPYLTPDGLFPLGHRHLGRFLKGRREGVLTKAQSRQEQFFLRQSIVSQMAVFRSGELPRGLFHEGADSETGPP